MELKKLLAVAVAAAFALPLAAQASAEGDRMILAQSGASSVGTGPTGGTPSPQSAGEPRAPTDSKADQRRCESMTGTERESCMRDARAAGTTSGSSSGTTGSATGGASSAPAGSTGTTAGPGEASPKVGSGSDTATGSSSSGTGKAGSGQ